MDEITKYRVLARFHLGIAIFYLFMGIFVFSSAYLAASLLVLVAFLLMYCAMNIESEANAKIQELG
jgi:hypothetical protein